MSEWNVCFNPFRMVLEEVPPLESSRHTVCIYNINWLYRFIFNRGLSINNSADDIDKN